MLLKKERLTAAVMAAGLVLIFFSCAKKQVIKPPEPEPEKKVVAPEKPPEPPVAVEEPEKVEAEQPARGSRFEKSDKLRTVYFDYDKYQLRADSGKILNENTEYLKKNKDIVIQLQGHCDERGTVGYNLALGQKRATSVRNYLVYQGISGSRITTISYGKEIPACSEKNEDCWARNRRVEFYEKQ